MLALFLQTMQSTFAYDFELDGFYYNITSLQNLTVELTHNGEGSYEGDIVVPEVVTYSGRNYTVTRLGDNAFANCGAVTSIRIPHTVTTIGAFVFWYCSNLRALTIPNSVTEIGKSSACSDYGRQCFYGCKNLEIIVFEEGSSQTLLLHPNVWQVANSSTFANCRLKKLYIGRNLDCLHRDYADYCNPFYYQTSLKEVKFGKDIDNIISRMFQGCLTLEEIDIPGNISIINANAFEDCTMLKKISLDEGITKIGPYAFKNCESIEEIIFPSTISVISEEAFLNCKGITKVLCQNEVPANLSENAFPALVYLNATLYVPKESIMAYKKAEGWKNFENIRTIEETAGYILSVSCNQGGRVYFLNKTVFNNTEDQEVKENQNVILSIIPDDGYYINSVTLNGRDIKDDLYNNTYTIAQIKENIDFRVEFAKVATYLSLKQPTGSMDIVVKEGESQTIRLVPESGYTIHSVTYNGKDVTNQLSEDNSFVTPVITDNSVLYVTYENGENPPVNHDKYLTIKHSENGDVKQKITPGRSYTYKISPVSGQKLAALYFNGVDVTSEIKGGKFTTPVLNDNATLEIEFEAE